MLAKLEKVFGGTVIDKSRGEDTPAHWKQAWIWRLAPVADVVEAIEVMWPYLASRRRGQLQPILDAVALMPPPGTSGRTHCKQGHALVPENLIPRREGDKHYRRCLACRQASWTRQNNKRKQLG